MTSLLRDEIPVPIAAAASATTTSAPERAAARATASPTTPAPTTKTCIEQDLQQIRSAPDGGVRAFSGPGKSGPPPERAINQECDFSLIDKRLFRMEFTSSSLSLRYRRAATK